MDTAGLGAGSRRTTRRPARRVGVVVAAIAAGLAIVPAAGAFDAVVGEIHVTQGVQTAAAGAPEATANEVPLIANRSTAVRVAIPVSGGTGVITGRLRVFVGANEVTPAGGVAPVNTPFTPPASPDLGSDDGALLFELPAPSGIAPPTGALVSNAVRVRVEIEGQADENPANNTGEVTGLRVERRVAPEILWLPVTYTPASSEGPDLQRIAEGVGDAGIVAALPIDDSCRECVYRRLPGVLTHDVDANGDGKLSLNNYGPPLYRPEYYTLGEELIARRAMLRFPGNRGPSDSTYLFGWVRDGALAGHAGAAWYPPTRVGYAHDRQGPSAGTFTTAFQNAALHEMAHMLGVTHNPVGRFLAPTLGFDVGGRLIGNPDGNGAAGRVRPGSTPEIMNEAGNGLWPDAQNYSTARLELPLGASATCPRVPVPTLSIVGTTSQIPAAELLAAPAPAGFRVNAGHAYIETMVLCERGPAGPLRTPLIAHLVLQRAGARGSEGLRVVRVPIESRLVPNGHSRPRGAAHDHRELVGPFHLAVRLGSSTIRELRITDSRRSRTFVRLTPSRHPPEIAITSPRPGARLGRRTVIRWRTSDRDTARARLAHRVAYSADNGRTWIPVAARLDGRRDRLVLDARAFPASRRPTVLLRVDVSDGLNSSSATVRGLVNAIGLGQAPSVRR